MKIILLVDASGSMSSYLNTTKDTIKSIINDLQKNDFVYLGYFNSSFFQIAANDYVKNIDVSQAASMYRANGGTPITDAVYKAIVDCVEQFQSAEELNTKHRFVIFTDGEENSSYRATSQELGQAIEHLSDSFGWEFQFIGPKNQSEEISKYTQTIKVRPDNVTLYSDMTDGLKEMRSKVLAH